MANRETVTLRFTNPPTAAQSTLITRRIREEDVPKGAEGASTALGDYDFPGFDIGKTDGHPCLEKASWRSPHLRIEKISSHHASARLSERGELLSLMDYRGGGFLRARAARVIPCRTLASGDADGTALVPRVPSEPQGN